MREELFKRVKSFDVEFFRDTNDHWFTARVRVRWISQGGAVMVDHCDMIIQEIDATEAWESVAAHLKAFAEKL